MSVVMSSGASSASRGSLLAMPMLIINMGAEMVYILEQRLKAQAISSEKSKKVLVDVLKTMYSAKFISELFKPQEVYTSKATRAIFDRLAHSSIMRLNKTSMDKLYDLMTMGYKYQVLRVIHPSHLLQVTLTHLEAVRKMVGDVSAVADLIDAAIRAVIETYSVMSFGELWNLKHTLARFFQDRRIKVSLFLQDGLQNMDGTLVLDMTGPLPAGTEPPGTVRYFEPGTTAVAKVEKLPAIYVPGAIIVTEGSPFSAETRLCKLGDNLYAKERKSKAGMVAAIAGDSAETGILGRSGEPSKISSPEGKSPAAELKTRAAEDESTPRVGRAGLDLLASLVGKASESKEEDTFKFSLFGDDADLPESAAAHSSAVDSIITFDAGDRAALSTMLARLGWDNEDTKQDSKEGDDDLLAMMDEAVGAK